MNISFINANNELQFANKIISKFYYKMTYSEYNFIKNLKINEKNFIHLKNKNKNYKL